MDEHEPHRAELYVRSLAPCGTREAQEAILDRLRELERTNVVDEVDVTVWGTAVPLDGGAIRVGAGARIAERIAAFQRWCDECGGSIEPFFDWSVVESSLSGESFRRVVPPQRCLAVYAGDRLQDVFPCRLDGETYSLEDGLRLLEASRPRWSGPSSLSE